MSYSLKKNEDMKHPLDRSTSWMYWTMMGGGFIAIGVAVNSWYWPRELRNEWEITMSQSISPITQAITAIKDDLIVLNNHQKDRAYDRQIKDLEKKINFAEKKITTLEKKINNYVVSKEKVLSTETAEIVQNDDLSTTSIKTTFPMNPAHHFDLLNERINQGKPFYQLLQQLPNAFEKLPLFKEVESLSQASIPLPISQLALNLEKILKNMEIPTATQLRLQDGWWEKIKQTFLCLIRIRKIDNPSDFQQGRLALSYLQSNQLAMAIHIMKNSTREPFRQWVHDARARLNLDSLWQGFVANVGSTKLPFKTWGNPPLNNEAVIKSVVHGVVGD